MVVTGVAGVLFGNRQRRWALDLHGAPGARGLRPTLGATLLLIFVLGALTTADGKPDESLDAEERTVSALLKTMNLTADPCEDFYTYACGSWRKGFLYSYSRYDQVRMDIDRELQRLLSNLKLSKTRQPKCVRRAKDYYRSCMNREARERNGLQSLKAALLAANSSWPMITRNWKEDDFDITKIAAKMTLFGDNFLWGLHIHDVNSTTTAIRIQRPQHLQLNTESWKAVRNGSFGIAQHKDLLKTVALAYDSKLSTKKLDKDIKDVILYENRLISALRSEELSLSYIPMRLTPYEMMAHITNKVDWPRYMSMVFKAVGRDILPDDDKIVYVYDLSYLLAMGIHFHFTEKRIVANYLASRLILSLAKHLPTSVDGIKRLNFDSAWYGIECARETNECMEDAVGRLYVDNNFDEASRADVYEMLDFIKNEFRTVLNAASWLDETTGARARQKLDAVRAHLGYADYIKNDTILELLYADLENMDYNYLANVMRCRSHQTRLELRKFDDSSNLRRGVLAPASAMARKHHPLNKIDIAAGFLQPPHYGRTRLKALNYGSAGSALGHELLHGFGTEGQRTDFGGNRVFWWSDDSLRDFRNTSNCLVSQYGNYTWADGKLPSKRTMQEDIADNGGIVLAYKAYKNWTAINGEEQPLRGLNLTIDQLFYLSFAQTWCGTDITNWFEAVERVHSPNRYRVIGTLSNLDEFSRAFGCPSGSAMNPQVKCKVW